MDNVPSNPKIKKPDDDSKTRRKPAADKNSLEHRLDYVCNFLGIKKEQCKDQASLDFCLDDIFRMDFVIHFINLKELILIHQGIHNIEGLDRLRSLEKCWLTDNSIDSIKCLDRCKNLKELYMSSNKLTSTKGLERCVNLEKLWLDGNKIESIKGIGSLKKLEHLNLADN